MKPNKQTIIATCALLIFLPEVMKAEELKGSFLQGIGDAFFGLLKSEAEKEQEERQRIISGFSGSDGKLDSEEAEALRLYDQKKEEAEIELLGKVQSSQWKHMLNAGENIQKLKLDRADAQKRELDLIVQEVSKSIKSNDLIEAKLKLYTIEWLPIGDNKIDDYYSKIYAEQRKLLESEIK